MTSTRLPAPPDPPATAGAALAAGATVVTATERLARVLRNRHDLQQQAAGATAWVAADALPMGAFIARLAAVATEPLGPPVPDLPPPELLQLLWRDAIGDGGIDAGVLAGAAARAWHSAGLYGITAARLRAACDSPDAEAFSDWVQRYRARLRELGFADLHDLAWEFARGERALPRTGLPQALVVAGFDPLPPLYQALLARLAAAGVAVGTAAPPARNGRTQQWQAADAEAEIRAAACWARRCLEQSPGASVAVVVPDLANRGAAVRRAFLDVLDPGWRTRPVPGRRLAVSLGQPLARYPVIHAALAWLGLATGSAAWESVSLVLRSPFLGSPGESAGRARAELALRESGRTRFRPGAVVAALRAVAPASAGQLEAAANLAAAARPGPPSQLAGVLGGLLAAGAWPGEASRGSTTAQALASFRQLLETVAGSERLTGRLSLSRLAGLVAELAGERTFEPESAVAAVQVLGVLEAEGQDFDYLWVAGLRADRWPPPAQPLALLPLVLQRTAGMPEALPAALQALWARRFGRLQAAGGEVLASWPDRDGEEELLPSPLIAHLPPADDPVAGVASLQPDRDAIAATSARLESVADVPLPFTGQRVRGGTRLMSLQATNPAAAFILGRLHARDLPPAPMPLADAARGRLVHAMLQDLYARPECRHGLAAVTAAGLAAAWAPVSDAVLERFIPGDDPLAVALRRLEQARLEQLVWQLREYDATQGAFTVSVEETRQVSIGGLQFTVRLDRVEQHADGELVIDYKTGVVAGRSWWPPRPADAQLPVYALSGDVAGVAVLSLRPPQPTLSGLTGLTLGKGWRTPDKVRNLGIAGWPELYAAWATGLAVLAQEFRGGDFRVDRRARPRAEDQSPLLTRQHEATPDGGAEDNEAEGDEA